MNEEEREEFIAELRKSGEYEVKRKKQPSDNVYKILFLMFIAELLCLIGVLILIASVRGIA